MVMPSRRRWPNRLRKAASSRRRAPSRSIVRRDAAVPNRSPIGSERSARRSERATSRLAAGVTIFCAHILKYRLVQFCNPPTASSA
jgi:hypothetical protein